MKVDDREMQAELDRLVRMPTPRMRGLLDGELRAVYEKTNVFTHVETGSLKRSERIEHPASVALHNWEGALHFGGPSEPKEVDYAIYERARGGAHDFLMPAILSEPEWVVAIRLGLGREAL